MVVRMFKPKILIEAYSLARLQELSVAAIQQKPKPNKPMFYTTPNTSQKPLTLTTPTSTLIKQSSLPKTHILSLPNTAKNVPNNHNKPHRPLLTSKEMDEKRAKGLYFWCDHKFMSSHKCKKRQLFVLQVKEIIDEEELIEAITDDNEEGSQGGQHILNALWGNGTNQTMMVRGLSGKVRLHVLVDIGSTQNFINEQIEKNLNFLVYDVNGIYVEIANGQEMKCDALCKDFIWTMQQQEFKADMYLLPLGSYDLILRIQWLKTLGKIQWDFEELTMNFFVNNKAYFLKGEYFPQKEAKLNVLTFKGGERWGYIGDWSTMRQ